MSKLRITPNVPVVVELEDPDGEYDFEARAGQYQTTDGRTLILPRPAVIQLNELGLKPGEQVRIFHEAHRGKTSTWKIARPEAETAQDSTEAPPTRVGRPPKGQKAPKRRGRPPKKRTNQQIHEIVRAFTGQDKPQGKLFNSFDRYQTKLDPAQFGVRGTGTDGPAPVVEMLDRMPEPRVYRTAQEGLAILRKTPYGEMLRHIIRTVKTAIEAEQVTMGSEALEGLISMIYRDAAGRQGVEYDFREDK